METLSLAPVIAVVALALVSACAGGPSDMAAVAGRWGGPQASLTNQATTATLQIAAGGCYGSYGDTDQSIPDGQFSVPGTYTQLEGAYPGKVQYPAQFIGSVQGTHMQITVHVAALQDFGPFSLTRGVNSTLPMCLYP